MLPPGVSLRAPGAETSVCTTCRVPIFFDTIQCAHCTASKQEGGVFAPASEVVEASTFPTEMSVKDHRALLQSSTTAPCKSAFADLAPRSWAVNTADAIKCPIGTTGEFEEVYYREALGRVLLCVQYHCDGMKPVIRAVRSSAGTSGDNQRAVLSTFAEEIMSSSPLFDLKDWGWDLARESFAALIAKLNAAPLDTPAREAAWKTFIDIVPLPLKAPIAMAASRSWSDRILISGDGLVCQAFTPYEHIALLLTKNFVPILNPEPFARWMRIRRDDTTSAAIKSNDTASSFIGRPFDLGRIDPSGSWNGRSSTLADLSGSDDSDGSVATILSANAKAAARADTHDGRSGSDAASSPPAIGSAAAPDGAERVDSVTRNDSEWFRLRSLTTEHNDRNGWWRAVRDGEQLPEDTFVHQVGDSSFIRLNGGSGLAMISDADDNDGNKSGDTILQSSNLHSLIESLRVKRNEMDALIHRIKTNVPYSPPPSDTESGEEPARKAPMRVSKANRRHARRKAGLQRLRHSQPILDPDTSGEEPSRKAPARGEPRPQKPAATSASPSRSRRGGLSAVRPQPKREVLQMQRAAFSVSDASFEHFAQAHNIYGMRTKTLFEQDDGSQRFYYGTVRARSVRKGFTCYKVVYDDGEVKWYRPLELLSHFKFYFVYSDECAPRKSGRSTNASAAAHGEARSKKHRRKGQPTRNPRTAAASASDGYQGYVYPVDQREKTGWDKYWEAKAKLETRGDLRGETKAETRMARGDFGGLVSSDEPGDDSNASSEGDDTAPRTCVAGCGEMVDNRGDSCRNCASGYCARPDCDNPTSGGYQFCSSQCSRAARSQQEQRSRKRGDRSAHRARADPDTRARTAGGLLPHPADGDERAAAQARMSSYVPDEDALLGAQLGKGAEHDKYLNEKRLHRRQPIEILLELPFTLRRGNGRHAYSLSRRHKDYIRSRRREPPPVGAIADESAVIIQLSDGGGARTLQHKLRLPNQFPEIRSNDRMQELFDVIDTRCSERMAEQERIVNARDSTMRVIEAAEAVYSRWRRLQYGVNNLRSLMLEWLRDARCAPSPVERRTQTSRCWTYLEFVLYIARHTDDYSLICFGRHAWLWERAQHGGFPPPRSKLLRDPWKIHDINAVASYGTGASASSHSSSAATSRGGRGSNDGGGAAGRRRSQKRKTPGDKLPPSVMANAPPSVYDVFQGKCLKCGSTQHNAAACPVAATVNPTAAQQSKLVATAKKRKEIKKKRDEFIRNAKKKTNY